MIRKQLKICFVLSPGGVIQAFPEPESERGKILLLMVKNIDSCSRMRATFLFMNYPRDPKSLSSLSLKVRLKVATFLMINHPILSQKSIKSKLKSQMEDYEGLPTLSPPVKEFKLAKIQVNYNQLPRSR